ncbi:RNA dependent RNA polymerase-domain-containing protein [Fennellomyces sp. T-0311]|nr:RNA dependent RNA polymerase-domain-containing protein [Fennellomyces sp. T-0311]
MENDKRTSPGKLLKEIASKHTNLGQRKKKKTKRLISVKKILVTPTTLRIEPPQVETANRVLRQFRAHLDRFLRVQFIDERGTQVHTSSNMSLNNDAVYNRLARVLRNGIQIGSVHYTFLAFSSSQLREHGCWFFANTTTVTVDNIRRWMGNFSEKRVAAKYAARMGQCFSSTQAITKLAEEQVEVIPDIERNEYTFSDGVGLISPELAQVVAHAHRHRQAQTSSAFQFRLGGAKGVLTVAKHLKEKVVQLRPSQIKFVSTHRMLEINRVGYASPVYLNRQVILLLSSLGVEDYRFMELLKEMLSQIDNILQDPVQCGVILKQNSDEYGIHRSMERIVSAGFLEAGDAYITNLIKVFRVSRLKEAKKKAKIHVPDATFALGVLDETNTLEPNQIFFQFIDGKVIQGDVVLYRCPCLHPGDVRVVQAVDCPALHDLHEVIVFSQKGERDVPSMCSGGDLDGDTYSIIWDNRLFPTNRNADPMTHKVESPGELNRHVEVSDIQDFFLDYVQNDNLGQIANAHMVFADMSPDGACADVCKRWAERHSVAVDFPKTGKVADISDMELPTSYPDFMEKKSKRSYESPKVLGQLYRAIDVNELNEYENGLESNPKYDNRMWVAGMEKYVYAARTLKEKYDEDVRDLMRQFGVPTEAELMSGSIVKWLKQDGRESFYEARNHARREVHRLREHWRHQHFPSLRKKKPKHSRAQKEEDEAKAAAWYYVTYHEVEQLAEDRRNKRLLSFPWVAEEILCKFARTNPNTPHAPLAELTVCSYARSQSNSSATTSSDEE